MPKKPKTIKVRLTKKVDSFRLANVSYKPGDVFECPIQFFRSDFMEKVVPPEKVKPTPLIVEKPDEKPIEEASTEETPHTEEIVEETPAEELGEAIVVEEKPDEKSERKKRNK